MDKFSNKEIVSDIRFCKELMDRLVTSAENMGVTYWDAKHTVIQNDIIRLRRELNSVRRKLDSFDYKWGENE